MRDEATHKTDALLADLGSVAVGKNGEILAKSAGLDDDVVKLLVEYMAESDVGANSSACAEREVSWKLTQRRPVKHAPMIQGCWLQ